MPPVTAKDAAGVVIRARRVAADRQEADRHRPGRLGQQARAHVADVQGVRRQQVQRRTVDRQRSVRTRGVPDRHGQVLPGDRRAANAQQSAVEVDPAHARARDDIARHVHLTAVDVQHADAASQLTDDQVATFLADRAVAGREHAAAADGHHALGVGATDDAVILHPQRASGEVVDAGRVGVAAPADGELIALVARQVAEHFHRPAGLIEQAETVGVRADNHPRPGAFDRNQAVAAEVIRALAVVLAELELPRRHVPAALVDRAHPEADRVRVGAAQEEHVPAFNRAARHVDHRRSALADVHPSADLDRAAREVQHARGACRGGHDQVVADVDPAVGHIDLAVAPVLADEHVRGGVLRDLDQAAGHIEHARADVADAEVAARDRHRARGKVVLAVGVGGRLTQRQVPAARAAGIDAAAGLEEHARAVVADHHPRLSAGLVQQAVGEDVRADAAGVVTDDDPVGVHDAAGLRDRARAPVADAEDVGDRDGVAGRGPCSSSSHPH